jgi:hypothetical protein
MSSTTGAWAYASRGAVPGLPTGQSIAVYDSYADAQRAVDYLADQQFPVQHLAIVGTDLKQIERVTGRLTWGKVLLGGVAGGAWIGLLIGLLFALFTPEDTVRILIFSVVWAAIFGAILAGVGYAFTGGRRDFTSMTATIASRYACRAGSAASRPTRHAWHRHSDTRSNRGRRFRDSCDWWVKPWHISWTRTSHASTDGYPGATAAAAGPPRTRLAHAATGAVAVAQSTGSGNAARAAAASTSTRHPVAGASRPASRHHFTEITRESAGQIWPGSSRVIFA